ncbi:MAG: hypothetical protein IKO48_00590 [Elusimicrobia bacterium]|nr:hypothetical protein [Elusimicrobiota bacterium]
MKKIVFLFFLITIFSVCFAAKIDTTRDINRAPKIKNYEIIFPTILALDSRTALTRNEINIVDKKEFNNLLKYKKIYSRELNTIVLKNTKTWVDKLQTIAYEIKKHPRTIVIVEGFRNTELTEKENIAVSKEHALFIASILRDVYKIENTMAAIGRGTEKNENLIYNCVIISLIKDIDPSQSI